MDFILVVVLLANEAALDGPTAAQVLGYKYIEKDMTRHIHQKGRGQIIWKHTGSHNRAANLSPCLHKVTSTRTSRMTSWRRSILGERIMLT